MTNDISSVTRPDNTYSKSYTKCKNVIERWRGQNKELLKKYNREYQRKLRKDPVKYQELTMRINIRSYLSGQWKESYKAISALGMTRKQIADKHNMTETDFVEMLKNYEIDHIISASWFNIEDNNHLKPFMYRHYNIQFLPRYENRSKHKYVDEDDIRVQYVKLQLELDYYHSQNQYDDQTMSKISDLARKANLLKRRIKKMYK